MFGRGRRKARTIETVDAQVETPTALIEIAAEATPLVTVVPTPPVPAEIALDVEFMAMMSQLDDSLSAMARACDRIEQAVAARAGVETAAAA